MKKVRAMLLLACTLAIGYAAASSPPDEGKTVKFSKGAVYTPTAVAPMPEVITVPTADYCAISVEAYEPTIAELYKAQADTEKERRKEIDYATPYPVLVVPLTGALV